MNTYVYAVCDYDDNHIRTVNACSMQQAKEKLIEKYRDELELDEEFNTWADFVDFMWDRDIFISESVYDVESF